MLTDKKVHPASSSLSLDRIHLTRAHTCAPASSSSSSYDRRVSLSLEENEGLRFAFGTPLGARAERRREEKVLIVSRTHVRHQAGCVRGGAAIYKDDAAAAG